VLSDWTPTHADLEGYVMPSEPLSPPAEGNPTAPLWPPLAIDESTAATLKAITALLTRQADACKPLGLLPVGYYGEDCDFEEFFRPEAVLRMAKENPLWACLDDTQGYSLRQRLAESVRATIQEMHRAFDHRQPVSARLRMRMMAACRKELAELYAELHAEAQNAPEWECEV
jgi:hypothetical protein